MNLHTILILGTSLFAIGIYTALSRNNLISILMGIEMILNGVMINLAGWTRFSGLESGWTVLLFIMMLAVMEAVVALAIFYTLYRRGRGLSADSISRLRR
jgi:NADH-quinone oxidoreductase subunit K